MSINLNFQSDCFNRALDRAKASPVLVRVGWQGNNVACYMVRGRSNNKAWGMIKGFYKVAIFSADGKPSASCSCLAGFNNSLCWHIASATAFHSNRVRCGARSPILGN